MANPIPEDPEAQEHVYETLTDLQTHGSPVVGLGIDSNARHCRRPQNR